MGDEDWEAEIITPHLSSYVPVLEKVARGRAGGRPRGWCDSGATARSAPGADGAAFPWARVRTRVALTVTVSRIPA